MFAHSYSKSYPVGLSMKSGFYPTHILWLL